VRRLLVYLSKSWERYTAFYDNPGVPWTNNGTEQTIGKMKMRARITRGYKTMSGMLNGPLVSGTSPQLNSPLGSEKVGHLTTVPNSPTKFGTASTDLGC
jgi:hypothetical protein